MPYSNSAQNLLRETLSRVTTEFRKKLRGGHSLSELHPDLITGTPYFQSPPFDASLLEAVRRITPQFRLAEDESSRALWQASQNGSSWGEFEALESLLKRMERPRRVLEVGPGLGRSAVFLKKALGWNDVPFDLYEGEGSSTKYTADGPRFDDSFCGDLEQLRRVLVFNGIEQANIVDAADLGYRLDALKGPYDLLYSFYAIGYHWSLEEFLDEVTGLLSDRGVGVFTVHKRFKPFAALADLPHTFIQYRRVLPKHRMSNLLVIAENERVAAELFGARN